MRRLTIWAISLLCLVTALRSTTAARTVTDAIADGSTSNLTRLSKVYPMEPVHDDRPASRPVD